MQTEELIKMIEQKELELKKLSNEIYLLKAELQKQNNSQMIEMSIDEKTLEKMLNDIFGEEKVKSHNIIGIKFEVINDDANDIFIDLDIDKEPYIKELTSDKVINLTGQSGSGKSYYAKQVFNTSDYLIIDTDDIFSEKRFLNASGINRELGDMFRNKYAVLPSLGEEFDLIYQEILDYCKDFEKTIVIDCAVFHCIKNIKLLKGKIIIMRTSINTCYQRCIERFKRNNPDYTEEEFNNFSKRKKKIFIWYKYSNEFIKNIDKL